MPNLPNITPAEVAVLGAAVLLFVFSPALLAWNDARRRRRAQRALESVAAATPVDQLPTPPAEAVEPASPVSVPFEVGVSSGGPSLEIQPLDAPARHHFQLQELHQVRLPDWPPDAVRNDAQCSRWWHAAEQLDDPFRTTIISATIWSPYPARSSCLGAAEATGPKLCLRILLFPIVWPVSQNQAVAQAVFEIDRERGEVRGWVDALRPQELTEENRREILESGGAP